MRVLLCLTAVLTLVKTTLGYNILAVFATQSLSHQVASLGITRALARHGHQVTVITANPFMEKVENHTEIDGSIVYKIWEKYQEDFKFDIQQKRTAFECLPHFEIVFAKYFDGQISLDPVQKLLKSSETKFDAVIYEGFYLAALGLAKYYNAVPVAMFTVPTYFTFENAMGNPLFTSYMPSFLTGFNDRMSFMERAENTVFTLFHLYIQRYHAYRLQDEVMRKHFGQDYPSTRELQKNTSLLILNGDMSNFYPTPRQPNTIMTGPMHIDPRKPLPQDLKKWMDAAEEGVIYFSLGSNMKGISMPQQKREVFIKVFERFPRYRIVWKWESDTPFSGKPDNVLLRKWNPQQDMLAHPKMKLFISQAGHQSRQESVYYGVPILSIPLFWDQEFNAKKIETEGAGLTIQFEDITFEDVYAKVKKLLTDPSYSNNMKRLSRISRDQPMSPQDTVNWWIEYVIRHKGAPHLRPAVLDLEWYQVCSLDIIAVFLSAVVISIYSIYYILRSVFSACFQKEKLKSH